MSDVTSPDNDNIRVQQERDLGHKLDHGKDKHRGPPDAMMKPVDRSKGHRLPVEDKPHSEGEKE